MAKHKPKKRAEVRNRVVGTKTVFPHEVQEHPLNWREHGALQTRAMDDALGELGFVKPTDVYIPQPEDTLVTEGVIVGGQLRKLVAGVPCLMDGHLRKARLPADFRLTLNVTDLNEREALMYLATCDPLSALAGQDDEALIAVLSKVDSDSAALQEMLAKLVDLEEGGGDGDKEVEDTAGKFQVIVTCKDEDEQRALVEEFLSRGIEHRAVLA